MFLVCHKICLLEKNMQENLKKKHVASSVANYSLLASVIHAALFRKTNVCFVLLFLLNKKLNKNFCKFHESNGPHNWSIGENIFNQPEARVRKICYIEKYQKVICQLVFIVKYYICKTNQYNCKSQYQR